jgi:2-polyprenyl-3-methyl-5-hydroxy-6-metoxy-1,4-benzoquinol methylase
MTTSAELTGDDRAALELSAPLARRLAAARCRVDPETGRSCAWYHGLWQYLRLFELVETPRYHAAFFREALAALPERRDPAILVSGAADYSMAAHVVAGCRELGRAPKVTVLDRCETPLQLNRWYAERAGIAIETRCLDVLACEESGQFDGIFTHAFLGRFPPAQRAVLFTKWRQLLRPGGAVATVTPVRPGDEQVAGFDARGAEALRETVRGIATAWRGALDVAPATLADEAWRYAQMHRVHPVRSAGELHELLEAAGLRVARLEHVASLASMLGVPRGPTIVGSAAYLRIVAVLP